LTLQAQNIWAGDYFGGIVDQRGYQKWPKDTQHGQTMASTTVQDDPRRSSERNKGEKSGTLSPWPGRGGLTMASPSHDVAWFFFMAFRLIVRFRHYKLQFRP